MHDHICISFGYPSVFTPVGSNRTVGQSSDTFPHSSVEMPVSYLYPRDALSLHLRPSMHTVICIYYSSRANSSNSCNWFNLIALHAYSAKRRLTCLQGRFTVFVQCIFYMLHVIETGYQRDRLTRSLFIISSHLTVHQMAISTQK